MAGTTPKVAALFTLFLSQVLYANPGDFDNDCDTELDDFAQLTPCVPGRQSTS